MKFTSRLFIACGAILAILLLCSLCNLFFFRISIPYYNYIAICSFLLPLVVYAGLTNRQSPISKPLLVYVVVFIIIEIIRQLLFAQLREASYDYELHKELAHYFSICSVVYNVVSLLTCYLVGRLLKTGSIIWWIIVGYAAVLVLLFLPMPFLYNEIIADITYHSLLTYVPGCLRVVLFMIVGYKLNIKNIER